MKCPHCKAAVPDKFSFCPQCGAAVRTESGKVIRPDGTRRVINAVLIGVLAANIAGGAFLIHRIHKKNQSPPETSIAEVQPEESSEAPKTEAPKKQETEPETAPETEPETKAPATKATTKATTVKTTEKTTEKTTVKTTKQTEAKTTAAEKTTKAAKTTKSGKTTAAPKKDASTKTTAKAQQQPAQQQQPAEPVQQEEPQQQRTAAADYFASLGGMPFVCGNNGDPFLPPGMYTRATNDDGKAQSEADAKQAMLNLPIDWGYDADIFCGTTPDNNGTSNSTYRYITNAFPVPGFADLQLPAAIDLYIHNGTAAHGNHLRAIDYRFGNHPDYSGPYIWTRGEIESYFNALTAYADELYGGHEEVGDSTLAHYRYQNGALDIGYYERNGKYILWISRSND